MKTQTTKLYQNKPHLKLTLMMDMYRIATAVIENEQDWQEIISHKTIGEIANALNDFKNTQLKRKRERAKKLLETTKDFTERPAPPAEEPPFYLRPSSNPNPSPTQPKEGDT